MLRTDSTLCKTLKANNTARLPGPEVEFVKKALFYQSDGV
jgi:hypothetical protein